MNFRVSYLKISYYFVQWSVLLPVVLTLIATQTHDSKFVKTVADFCYPRWALEAFVIANAERYAITLDPFLNTKVITLYNHM